MQNKVVRFIEKAHADFLYQHIQYICKRLPKVDTDKAGIGNSHEFYSDSVGEAMLHDKPYPMEIGEGVLYRGEDQIHGRHPLPYESHAQLFLHYIELDGKHYPEFKFDRRPGLYFKKNRP